MTETPSEAKRLNASQRAAGSSPRANTEEAGIHRQYQQQKNAAHERADTSPSCLKTYLFVIYVCDREREKMQAHTCRGSWVEVKRQLARIGPRFFQRGPRDQILGCTASIFTKHPEILPPLSLLFHSIPTPSCPANNTPWLGLPKSVHTHIPMFSGNTSCQGTPRRLPCALLWIPQVKLTAPLSAHTQLKSSLYLGIMEPKGSWFCLAVVP